LPAVHPAKFFFGAIRISLLDQRIHSRVPVELGKGGSYRDVLEPVGLDLLLPVLHSLPVAVRPVVVVVVGERLSGLGLGLTVLLEVG